MPKKPALLLSLLNLVLKPLAGQTKASSNHLVALSQHPPAHDRGAWCAYWNAQGQSWRTEPEIDMKRQEYLAGQRAIVPNIDKGVYPFKGVKLNRADVEWLLATHESRLGPIDGNDERQRNREGLDLRGADLTCVNLRRLPLAAMCGGLNWDEWERATPRQRADACVYLEGADLKRAHLEGALLTGAHLEGANLNIAYMKRCSLHWAHLEGTCLVGAHLEGTNLGAAHLEGANLNLAHLEGANLYTTHFGGKTMSAEDLEQIRKYISDFPATLPPAILSNVFFDSATNLRRPIFGDEKHGFVRFTDVSWGDVNLALVDWSQINMLGEEKRARQKKRDYQVPWGPLWSVSEEERAQQRMFDGGAKQRSERLQEYEAAVRANRQLAMALQSQGLNEQAARFAYRAQVLQRHVFWFEMVQRGVKLRQRGQALGAWLFSWFLFLISGYGYKLWRSFLVYVLVIIGFTTTYYLLGAFGLPSLSLVNALGLSMTSFHGRGFFPGVTQLNDPLTILASIEAFVGLILEATFIATLTQRFFGK